LAAFARLAQRAGIALVLFSLGSCGRPASAFEGKRAYAWLERQCEFGPRVPGTQAHDSCFAYLTAQLRLYAPVVETDTFYYDSPELHHQVKLMNVVAHFRPKLTQRVLFGAHWDSRPWADQDPVPAKRHMPVLGANDGASGVAVLLEMARLMAGRSQPGIGVDLVFFDGEDLGTQDNPSGFFRGSNRYVEQISNQKPPLFVVVLDMVGKKDLALHWEGNSRKMASNIVDLVWGEAKAQSVLSFRSDVRYTIYDDHIPFLTAGIPAVDLIDFDYPPWHTTHDTPDKCDPESLEGVGKVLMGLVTRPNFLSN